MKSQNRIPAPVIGLLSTILPDHFTHDQLNGIFLTAGAPEDVPGGSKVTKVQNWLRAVNVHDDPLGVLGGILESFMDMEPPSFYSCQVNDQGEYQKYLTENYHDPRDRIRQALAKDGLQYVRGGHITTGQGTPTLTLMDLIKQRGLAHVDVELRRALENLEKDPAAACLAAGTVLESVFKTYLDRHSVEYRETDTLSSLWSKVADHIGMRPREMEDADLKRIVSGMHSVVNGLMNLRNRKSSAHGKSDKQSKSYSLKPRHARLAVHAAHTLAVYVIDAKDGE